MPKKGIGIHLAQLNTVTAFNATALGLSRPNVFFIRVTFPSKSCRPGERQRLFLDNLSSLCDGEFLCEWFYANYWPAVCILAGRYWINKS